VRILNDEVKKMTTFAYSGSRQTDIWEGMWLDTEKVRLKVYRRARMSDKTLVKDLEKVIAGWHMLHHEHVLSRFYGIMTNSGWLYFVSPWQEHGNVLAYSKTHPDANRMHLLHGAALGMKYLHSCNVVHGNLKCANILLASNGEARICDVGMSTTIQEICAVDDSIMDSTGSNSARWLAPELMDGPKFIPTFATDTYSFAMTMLELFTLEHPFADQKSYISVIHRVVIRKQIPTRPQLPDVKRWLTDDLWELMRECWSRDPLTRPLMNAVAVHIKSVEASLQTESDLLNNSS